MIRTFLRFFGLISLAGGFAALVVDGTRSIAASGLLFTHVGETLEWMAPQNYDQIEPAVERVHPLLWNSLVVHLFDVPTWLIFSVLGLTLIVLGRPRAPQIGFSSRP